MKKKSVKQSDFLKNYLQQHDMVYELMPTEWLSGIPMANGEIGIMLWGENNRIHLTLDKNDVWEIREIIPDYSEFNYQNLKNLLLNKEFGKAKQIFESKVAQRNNKKVHPTRLPLPRVEIEFPSNIKEFDSRLDLFSAICNGRIKLKNFQIPLHFRCYVHSQTNLVIFRFNIRHCEGIDTEKISNLIQNIKLSTSIEHLKAKGNALHPNQLSAYKTLKSWGYKDPVSYKDAWNEIDFHWQEIPEYGGYLIGRKMIADHSAESHSIIILISLEGGTDETYKDKIVDLKTFWEEKIVNQLKCEDTSQLVKEHKEFWNDYWSKSFVSIPDSKLENLFYLELYKLGSSSRKGKLPCSLQGLWTKDGTMPPWSGDYHLDMNIQETYWPTYPTNHLDVAEPLNRFLLGNKKRFEENCQNFFGFKGVHSGCAIGRNGERVFGYYTAEYWPGNIVWAVHNLWLYWRFTWDKRFLKRRLLPYLEDCFSTYSHLLEEDENGYLCLPISYSPEYYENQPKSWGKNATGEIGLIRFLIHALKEAYAILQIDNDREEYFEKLLYELDYPADLSGFQIYEGEQLNFSHRHFSHLMPIHPLGLVTRDGDRDDQYLIESSLKKIREMGTGNWTGWSWPWMSLIASRAGNGEMAWKMLQDYFCFITPNSFHINGDPRKFGLSHFTYNPMTLEAGFCSIAAVSEMLIQSWNGIIRIFPTIPEFWKDAYFQSLRTERAFLIDALLLNRKILFVKIKSLAGNECIIENSFGFKTKLFDQKFSEMKTFKQTEMLKFNTVKGETYFIARSLMSLQDSKHLKDKVHIEKLDSKSNWFGKKRFPSF
ncbi:MAG: hypothetical protein GF364_07135 [Candidatus Lokiarchaeota archaeon]|nr:hypothetical protein [Candidatus Lokiarchaeota archaeon]